MANIELVIKLDEDEYRNILHTGKANFCVVNAIEAGTILPKGHGRLIDADSLWNAYHDLDYDFYEALDLAETIIEADKKVRDKE